MSKPAGPWVEVLERLGLSPVGIVEDGIEYAVERADASIAVTWRGWRASPTARVVVRPRAPGNEFLLVPRRVVPTEPRYLTGDPAFDQGVAIVVGGQTILPRLGRPERDALLELVGGLGASVGATQATLEPAVTTAVLDAQAAVVAVEDLVRLTVRLAADPPVEELLGRWLVDEGAPSVSGALSQRVVQALPELTEVQAEMACRLLVERSPAPPPSLVAAMPPYPVVLRVWFRIGDPLDPRIAVRVEEAFLDGFARPIARYLGWLLAQDPGRPEIAQTIERLQRVSGLLEDQGFARELVRTIRADLPPASRVMLQAIEPRSSSVARRVAPLLADFQHPEADARLVEWLNLPGSGVRKAAAQALAERAVTLLDAADLEGARVIADAARRSGILLGALVTVVPARHDSWLASLRPHGEPDAVALIRRLGDGGADVDEALLYWLDRGTRTVRLEAAEALGRAGSPRAGAALRERATGWLELFGDAAVREACRRASEEIRRRAGGRGNLALARPRGGSLAEVPRGGEVSEDS